LSGTIHYLLSAWTFPIRQLHPTHNVNTLTHTHTHTHTGRERGRDRHRERARVRENIKERSER
jgi:hypothetical protein